MPTATITFTDDDTTGLTEVKIRCEGGYQSLSSAHRLAVNAMTWIDGEAIRKEKETNA